MENVLARYLIALIIAIVTTGGAIVEALPTKPLVEFARADQPSIEVFAAEKRSTPVSRHLYGWFAEHLFDNVYFGMWAQMLRNTGFEPSKYFGNAGEEDLQRRLQWREGYFGVPDQLESYKNGTAYYWIRYGKGDVIYSPAEDRINSDSSQKIEIRSLETPDVGIGQPIFAPTHRTGEYEVGFWAKGTCTSLHVAIRETDGKRLGGAEVKLTQSGWKRYSATFKIDRKGVTKGQALLFTISVTEPGTIFLDQCMLFPTDNLKGFDPDVVRMFREANMPLLRFPGGNFVSGYRWEEGIGPIDERPMRNNCAWNCEEYNHVGTDKWLTFCELVGSEAMICVNAGDGTPEEAANWVEYCNGAITTKYGALRAKNGHPEPYGVKLWEVGNELWGGWQIGHSSADAYADRYKAFHDAMIARDPDIRFVANGQDPGWNAPVIAKHPDLLRSLSLHLLIGAEVPADTPAEKMYAGTASFPVFAEQDILRMLKQMSDGGVKDPRIAITEMMIYAQRPGQPNCDLQAEVPFYAGMLNLGIRLDGKLEMLTRTAIVNHGAGLRKVKEMVFANPVYYANKLYGTQSGRWPVRLRITGPHYDFDGLPSLPAVKDASCLDAVALLDDSGKELNLLVTNRSAADELSARIALKDFTHKAGVRVQSLSGKDFMAGNSFDNPTEITLKQSKTEAGQNGLTHSFPPCSLTCLTFFRD